MWTVALENVLTDVQELEKGVKLARRESELRQNLGPELREVLSQFMSTAEGKYRLARVSTESATAIHPLFCIEVCTNVV